MTLKTAIAAAALAVSAIAAAPALAQDYNDWSSISPYGLEMVDPYGNVVYVDPYAYDSQVDMYGNVVSSYDGYMDPSLGYYDVTPAWQDTTSYGYDSSSSYYDANPYAGATNSHDSFLEMIWE